MLQDGNLLAGDPFDLGGVRTLAALANFQIEYPPSKQNVQAFADMLGRKPVYGEDIPRLQEVFDAPDGIPGGQVMDAIRASGLLDQIHPRNVFKPYVPNGSVVVIVTGGTLGWMMRRVEELRNRTHDWVTGMVFGLASGTRQCDTMTETGYPLAREYHQITGEYPREGTALQKLLEDAGFAPRMVEAPNLEQQVRLLLDRSPMTANATIYAPTNANATWVPLRIRRVIRESYGSFDEDGTQFVFSQDGVALAGSPEQARDTANYQRPLTVLPAIGRTVEELFLLQQ